MLLDFSRLPPYAQYSHSTSVLLVFFYPLEGAPPYVPTDQPLSDDLGILITGCESHQTSADVRPPGGKPHGALTASIRDVYNRNPNASYKVR